MKNEELSDALKNLQYLSGTLDSEIFTESDLDDIVKEARKKIKRQRLKNEKFEETLVGVQKAIERQKEISEDLDKQKGE
ncbi:hypothetical protein B4089_3719 [Bacillus licheniformis]|nr:hypothetical protein B4089_3620 [Bacillus licheniformis]OLF87249.1 hypothetical protein B4089_3719 [Bacillus licheniformis]